MMTKVMRQHWKRKDMIHQNFVFWAWSFTFSSPFDFTLFILLHRWIITSLHCTYTLHFTLKKTGTNFLDSVTLLYLMSPVLYCISVLNVCSSCFLYFYFLYACRFALKFQSRLFVCENLLGNKPDCVGSSFLLCTQWSRSKTNSQQMTDVCST